MKPASRQRYRRAAYRAIFSMSNVNRSTVAMPACVKRDATGLVEPSVGNSNDPSGPRTSHSTTDECKILSP